MAADHLGGYFGGTISFDEARMDEVLSALNLLVSRDAKIIAGHATVRGGQATLPFGLKDSGAAASLAGLLGSGTSVDELKGVFEGCEIKCHPLKPSVANRKHLELAKELESLTDVLPFSMADIAPKPALAAGPGKTGEGERNAAAQDAKADPFAGLIGLDDQVRSFRELATAVATYGRSALESMNVVLTGDPGVGKSSVAQAFAAYAKREGLVAGPFHQVSAENLIARYAGQTPSLVREQWSRARGGIFLLDEAYRLSQDSGGYGREALNTLNEFMERDRDTLVICAGYRKEMADFMDHNPGLAQRFAFHIDFPSYDDETLGQIFAGFARRKGFELDRELVEALPQAMRALKRDPHFANGRSARNLFDRCIIKQACYCGGGMTVGKEALDLALAELTEPKPASPGKHIGFLG